MKVPLLWAEPIIPVEAWGFYGGDRERMYCKVYLSSSEVWMFKRSCLNNMGYELPIHLKGVESVEEAMKMAQVYYFMDEGKDLLTAQQVRQLLLQQAQR